MMRKMAVAAVAIVLGASLSLAAQAKPSALDTAKAKAFVGTWVLTLEGGRGPQERTLTISDVGGKIAAELAGGRGGPINPTDITGSGNDLVLKWSQAGRGGGAEVPVVMTLTLKDGALAVKQDMAGGQFSQSGTGKKKG
jgi:hypothetical protein